MECWNDGMKTERKNVNRGFKRLNVWKDSVLLYILACKIFVKFAFELKKIAANSIDAAHSISRNISEGYCRKSLKEYLNYLNIALGSCGEFHSCYVSCMQAGQISKEEQGQVDHHGHPHRRQKEKPVGLVLAISGQGVANSQQAVEASGKRHELQVALLPQKPEQACAEAETG